MALTTAACQGIWLTRIMEDMQQNQVEVTKIFCNNQSTIAMAKNPVNHNRTRNVETRHDFIREQVYSGSIQIVYCSTHDQVAAWFAKPLSLDKFVNLRSQLGVVNFSIKGEYVMG